MSFLFFFFYGGHQRISGKFGVGEGWVTLGKVGGVLTRRSWVQDLPVAQKKKGKKRRKRRGTLKVTSVIGLLDWLSEKWLYKLQCLSNV